MVAGRTMEFQNCQPRALETHSTLHPEPGSHQAAIFTLSNCVSGLRDFAICTYHLMILTSFKYFDTASPMGLLSMVF